MSNSVERTYQFKVFHIWIHPQRLLLFLDWGQIEFARCFFMGSNACPVLIVCSPRTAVGARCKKALHVTTQLKQPGQAMDLGNVFK